MLAAKALARLRMCAGSPEPWLPADAINTVKPVLSGHSKERPKIGFKTSNRLMLVKVLQNALLEHSAIF